MKRVIISMMAVAALAACNNEGSNALPDNDDVLVLTSDVINHNSPREWKQDDKIGVYTLDGAASNVEFFNAAKDGQSANFKVVDRDQTLRYSGSTADVVAYYPYSASVEGGLYPLNVTNQGNRFTSDLIVADKTTLTKGEEKPLEFNHKLALVRINLIVGDDMSADDMWEIKLDVEDLKLEGSYNLLEGGFELASQSATIENLASLDNGKSIEFVAIPQNIASANCIFTSPSIGSIEQSITLGDIKGGKLYEFDATISRSSISISSANINPWDDQTEESGDANLTVNDPAQVGYYYYNDGSWSSREAYEANAANPVVGLIYKIDANNVKYVVSMEQVQDMWGVSDLVIGANSTVDGVKNMATVQSVDPEFANHPSFAMCNKMNGGNVDYATSDGTNVWYLPVAPELKAILTYYLDNEAEFNNWFTNAGGVAFTSLPETGGSHYWTSHEPTNAAAALTKAQYVRFTRDVSNGPWGQLKSNVDAYIRCVRKF